MALSRKGKEHDVPVPAQVMIETDKAITEVNLGDVKLWKDNPRKNEKAVPKLAEIIKVRGQISPIVVWRKNNVIYKGNTTYLALKLLGCKTAKVLYVDFPSEAAAIAYGIADNKSSEWSEWDESLLDSLMTGKNDIGQFGFSQDEVDKILGKRDAPDGFKSFDENIDTDHECPKCGYKWSA